MKRKIISVLLTLVLVLSFSLVTAVPAGAQATLKVVPYTLSTGDNEASWSTTQKATGSYSVLLTYVDGDNAYVEFTPATGITVSDLASIAADTWSWDYGHLSSLNGPIMELRFTEVGYNPADGWGHVDITLDQVEAGGAVDSAWHTVAITTASHVIWYGNDPTDGTAFDYTLEGGSTLADVLTAIDAETEMGADSAATWELTRVRAEIGWSTPARTCYIDDIEIAGVTYYGSIQDAIDTAIASDTITVAAGTYVEEVTVDKNLTITCTATCTITGDVHFDASSITMTDATLDTDYEWYVDSDTASIQDAIDAASASDTINVAAGTYVENLIVDQDNVTIKSISGAATTFIDGSGGNWGVTLGGPGQTIEDLTINRGGSVGGQAGVRLSSITTTEVGNGFTIKDCTFSDWGTSAATNEAVIGGLQFGLFTEGVTVTGGLIEGNTFSGNARTAIWLQTTGTGILDDLTIKDNHMLGCLEPDSGHGIRLQGVIGQNTDGLALIDGNTISDMSGMAIILRNEQGGTDADAGEATITGNTISGCYQGIDASAGWVLTITENTIANCDENGIKIHDGDQGTKVIKYNDISGNTEYGLKNEDITPDTITAQYNWWGKATGPYHATTNPGVTGYRGDTVSDNVTYAPWLYYTTAANSGATLATLVTNQVPAYAKAVVLDVVGWNTWSVPIGLDGQYNTWAKLITLTGLDYSLAYRFDSSSQTFVILARTTAYAIAPGEGFYIKMDTAGSIPYCYSTLPSVPSRNLSAGWSMIGGGMGAETELLSCTSIATVASTAGYTQILSPTQNALDWVWRTGDTTQGFFVLGEGYWVFLPIARVLGLVDLTPVAWAP